MSWVEEQNATTASRAINTTPAPPSRRTLSSIPAAAVGIRYGNVARPAGSFAASTAMAKIKPMRTRVWPRFQYSGRYRHSQPRSIALIAVPSSIQAAGRPQSTLAESSPKNVMSIMAAASMRSFKYEVGSSP